MSSGFFGSAFTAAYMVGQVIDLPFLPAKLPSGFMRWDGEIHPRADAPRLFRVIGHSFRRDDDTYDVDTHFRFGGGEVFRKGASYTPAVVTEGFTVLYGTPAVAGNVITFNHPGAGLGLVTANVAEGVTGKKRFAVTIAEEPQAGESIFINIGRGGLVATDYIQLNVSATGIHANTAAHPVAVNFPFAVTAGSKIGLWHDDDTGAWGFIGPDGVDTGDLSATIPAFTGARGAGLAFSTGGGGGTQVLTFHPDGDGLAFPGGYGDWPVDSSSTPASSNAGQRGGSNTTAGHALDISEIPELSFEYDKFVPGAYAGNSGLGGGLTFGGFETAGSDPVGGGQEHVHGLDPLHDKMILLVRV